MCAPVISPCLNGRGELALVDQPVLDATRPKRRWKSSSATMPAPGKRSPRHDPPRHATGAIRAEERRIKPIFERFPDCAYRGADLCLDPGIRGAVDSLVTRTSRRSPGRI